MVLAVHSQDRCLMLTFNAICTSNSLAHKMTQHVVPKKSDGAGDGEIVRPAFTEVPNGPHLSYNLPFDKACVKHVDETFGAKHVYILGSGSLSRNTGYVQQLRQALGDRVAGAREGMTPHTLWNEVLEVADDCRRLRADLIVTIGGGSLTDAAKIVTLVSNPQGPNDRARKHADN